MYHELLLWLDLPGEIYSEEYTDALRHLRHCKHEVLLFHTLHHRQELELDFDNRPTEFIDLESGKHLKVMPADVMDKYQEQMHRQAAELKRHTIQYRIDYQPVDVGLGMDQVLVPFLLKRSRHH